MLGVLICILRAAESSCLISDTGFYNFGVLDGTIMVIDSGSRGISEDRILKSTLTSLILPKFFRRANTVCVDAEDQNYLTEYLRAYREAHTIRAALLALELSWNLMPTCERSPVHVEERDELALDEEVGGNDVDVSSASSSQMRASKPHDHSDNDVALSDGHNDEYAIAWDCNFYSKEQFVAYYGGES